MSLRDWFWRVTSRVVLGPDEPDIEPDLMSRSQGWTECVRCTINTDGNPYQDSVVLMFWEAEPYEVVVCFSDGQRWKISRELLADGLCFRAGYGDVRFVPFPSHVRMMLVTPDGAANVIFRRADLTEFLDATRELVPEGEEHVDVPSDVSSLESAT